MQVEVEDESSSIALTPMPVSPLEGGLDTRISRLLAFSSNVVQPYFENEVPQGAKSHIATMSMLFESDCNDCAFQASRYHSNLFLSNLLGFNEAQIIYGIQQKGWSHLASFFTKESRPLFFNMYVELLQGEPYKSSVCMCLSKVGLVFPVVVEGHISQRPSSISNVVTELVWYFTPVPVERSPDVMKYANNAPPDKNFCIR
jgi:hypothetical protein